MSDNEVHTPKKTSRGVVKNASQVIDAFVEKFNETAREYKDNDPFLIAKQNEVSRSTEDDEKEVEKE
jgi:hypothetical protein